MSDELEVLQLKHLGKQKGLQTYYVAIALLLSYPPKYLANNPFSNILSKDGTVGGKQAPG